MQEIGWLSGATRLVQLVDLRAARKTVSDAKTMTYVILFHGSEPGGRQYVQ
jgi:hypothetical protein